MNTSRRRRAPVRRGGAGTETLAQAWDHAYPHPAWGYAAAESARDAQAPQATTVAGRRDAPVQPVLVARAR